MKEHLEHNIVSDCATYLGLCALISSDNAYMII